jgi:hypothetical protein
VSTKFDVETIESQRDVVRAAKLALLKIQAQQTAQMTNDSALEVEHALAHVAEALTDEMIAVVSNMADDLRNGH